MKLSIVVLLIAILSFAAISNGAYLRAEPAEEGTDASGASGPEEPKTPSEQREGVKAKIEDTEESIEEGKKKITELKTKKNMLTEQIETKKLRDLEKKKDEDKKAEEKSSDEKATEEKNAKEGKIYQN